MLVDGVVIAIVAYETTYRGVPVWVPYRRNHKGRRPPEKTRKTCVVRTSPWIASFDNMILFVFKKN